MTGWEIIITIAVVGVTTFFTRLISFLVFPPHKKLPPFVTFLGQVLPLSIMGLLVVLALKDVNLKVYPHGLPELMAGLITVGLHLWWHKALLSIVGGTAIYMLLVRLF